MAAILSVSTPQLSFELSLERIAEIKFFSMIFQRVAFRSNQINALHRRYPQIIFVFSSGITS
ncbi:hypothetical protein [Salegentibacter sp. 24]|uniref:hypothetical protein n=1 Tax=Salegentibacter sp. 24 TaxID=2183986 RepID=UPI001414E618|nr:hypothetical protein [Salegentibacter sp. 24]